MLLNTQVVAVNEENGEFAGVVVKDASGQKEIKGDACVIATGGNSYSSTGSTGDGYRFAKVWDTALHQYFRHLYLLM